MTAPARRLYSDPPPRGVVSVPRTAGPFWLSAATVSMGDALQANRGPVNRPSPSLRRQDFPLGITALHKAAMMKVSRT